MGNTLCCQPPHNQQTKMLSPEQLLKKHAALPCMNDQKWTQSEKTNVAVEFGQVGQVWMRIPETELEKTFAVEMIIAMLERGHQLKANTEIQLPREYVRFLITEAKYIFIKQEQSLIEVEAPVCITGDFHGQFYDLLRLMKLVGGAPPAKKFLVMGDFVDRGK